MADRYRVIIPRIVAAQLESIFQYIAQDSLQNAAGMIRQILDAIDQLETFPLRPIVPEQPRGSEAPVRSLPVQPYVVFFRVFESKKTVRIVRVMHGARRRPKRFRR